MPDREKVIKDLEFCVNGHFKVELSLATKILVLLKEQEAKWVEDKQGEVCRLIRCSNCGLTFIVGNNIPYDEWIEERNYCRRCGARMVKPND